MISCSVVRRALKRAGLDPEFKGAHLLRHSLATNLLRRGASLEEIGQLLRHNQPTTGSYGTNTIVISTSQRRLYTQLALAG